MARTSAGCLGGWRNQSQGPPPPPRPRRCTGTAARAPARKFHASAHARAFVKPQKTPALTPMCSGRSIEASATAGSKTYKGGWVRAREVRKIGADAAK